MTHRLGEIDKRMVDTQCDREMVYLRRLRRRLVQMFATLIGRMPPNPGPGKKETPA